MAAPRTPLVSLALLLVVSAAPCTARAGECFEGFRDDNSRRLFDVLAKAKPNDGCTLENLRTEKAQMMVEWMKEGRLQPAMVLVPTSCMANPSTSEKVSVIVPPSLEEACPAAVDLTRRQIAAGTLGSPATVTAPIAVPEIVGRPPRAPKRLAGAIAGGLVALVSLWALLLGARRGKASAAPATTTTPAAEPAEPDAEGSAKPGA